MSDVFRSLLPPAYKGVPFLYESGTVNGGRKIVTHEFPHENRRYNEDLGLKPRTFEITATLYSSLYFTNRTLFVTALNSKGSGILSHPFFGFVLVSVLNYDILEDNSEIGHARFRITFSETSANIFPLFGLENISGISNLVDLAEQTLTGELSESFLTKPHTAEKTVSKQEEFHSIVTGKLPPNSGLNKDEYNEFNEETKSFHDDRYNAAQNSETLSENTQSVFEKIDGISNDFEFLYNFFSKIFDEFGLFDKDVLATSQQLDENVFNRELYNSYVKTLCMLRLFLNSVKFEYKNDQDLTKIMNDLSEKYEEVVVNNTFADENWESIEEVRAKTFEYLSQLKVNKIVTTNVPRTTITKLMYNYYESFENQEEILKLNNITNPSIIEGDINIIAV